MPVYQPGNGKLIPIRDFAPDEPMTSPGIILDAISAIPTAAGFKPMRILSTIGAALPFRPIGAFNAYYADDTTALFAAVDNGLNQINFYRLSGGGWSFVGGPSAHTGALADFVQFGDDVYAVAGMVGGVARCPKGGVFNPVAGSPASATVITAASLQVLVFVGDRWFSSAISDGTNWTDSSATLAKTGRLLDAPGSVVAAAVINRNALAFKKNTVFLGQQGAPFGWSWELISGGSGTWSRGCVVQGPDFVAYVGMDDFWISTGYAPQRIPNNVKRWFFKNLNGDYVGNILGWFDNSESTIYWHFVSINAPDPPTCDRYVSYNTSEKRWCTGHEVVTAVPYLGVVATQLPKPTPANASIIFNGLFIPKRYSGERGPMYLTTGYHGSPSYLSQLFGIKPEYNLAPTSAVLTPFHVRELGKPDQQTEQAFLDADSGWYTCGQYDRYHKWLLATFGDTEVIGFTPEVRQGGQY